MREPDVISGIWEFKVAHKVYQRVVLDIYYKKAAGSMHEKNVIYGQRLNKVSLSISWIAEHELDTLAYGHTYVQLLTLEDHINN